MTGCKIGKIKMKNGGAPVYLISDRNVKNADAVEKLRDALAAIGSGEFVAIGIIAAQSNGLITTGFCETMKDHVFTGMAACDYFKKRLMETTGS